MQTITFKNLRTNLKSVMDYVSQGEEYVLTFQKNPVARIIPYQDPKTTIKDLDSLLESKEFTNAKIPKKLQEYDNFADFHKSNYSKYDKK
jgi:antitoxin (DNA-binding transcriptional repressor) of toxin-antitoxin stability system